MGDLLVEFAGSFYVLNPITDDGRDWIVENVAGNHPWGHGYHVDHRCIGAIVEGAQLDGLTVTGYEGGE
jgi:hypothetical protein